jgi:hypothetical protein
MRRSLPSNRNGVRKSSHDAVVVAGVERDVIASGLDHRADDIERLVAVERRDLDGDDVVDFGEAAPETSAAARVRRRWAEDKNR